jgi:uncharacterized protein
MNDKYAPILAYVKTLAPPRGSHGLDHTERVARLCEKIGRAENANQDVLVPAALLHDIARPLEKERGIPHEIEGARMAGEFLASIGFDPALIPAIAHAIRAHRFRSSERPETLEAQILSDADKLDAIGAAGIARTFLRAAEHGGDIRDGIAHFHGKLLMLKDLMYTVTGRRIAEERHRLLTGFLETLEAETGGAGERI